MQFADAPGWLMSEETSRDVLVALYIRDVLDVRPPSGLPRLEPQIGAAEHARTMREQRVLEIQWEHWWESVVDEGEIERVQHRDGTALTRLVAEREREIGRRARSFRLRIEVLPFDEPGLWWIGDSAVAVSETLRDDSAAFAEFMRPVIAHVA